jgi:hypothetical protein
MQDFIKMLSVLSAMLVEQQESLEGHRRTIIDREAEIDDLKLTIKDTKLLYERIDELSHSSDLWEKRYWDEHTRHDALARTLADMRANDPTAIPKAMNYMETTGQFLKYEDGSPNKLGTIKEVRLLTGWGLKETKDWVLGWLAKQEKKSA